MRRALSALVVLIVTSCASPAQAKPPPKDAGWGHDHRWVGPVEEHPHPGEFGEVIA